MPDARSIISQTALSTLHPQSDAGRRYTLHSHTEYCDGRAQIQAFIPAAIDAGMTLYGVTPHSPISIESPCNMTRANVPRYLAEVDRLADIYGDRITLLKGMEIDYIDSTEGPSDSYFNSLGLDYTIGSVHFIKSQQGIPVDIDGRFESFVGKMERYFHNDIRYVVDKFFDTSLEMIDRGGFDIIGHFDKIGHNASLFQPGIEDTDRYKQHIDRIIRAIIDSKLTVEINTKAYREHNRFFPAVTYWQRLFEAGVPVVVNSDAHVPALVNAGRDEAFEIIDRMRAGLSTTQRQSDNTTLT